MVNSRTLRAVALIGSVGLMALGAPSIGSAADESPGPSTELTKVRYVLPWVIQGESAANLVAKELGYYEEAGLDVEIIPGGPDIRAAALLASGSAEFASGPVAGLLTARAEGMPLVGLYTQNQSDGVVWVCKATTGIDEFADLGGKRVGVWFGSNDSKLLLALRTAGVPEDSVQILPQKFSMVEFYENLFDCASATVWNELHVVLDAGYAPEEINILDTADELGIYVTGDSGYTTETMINEQPEVVQAFVDATIRGSKYALDNPEEAAAIVQGFAPDLDLRKQLLQVEEVNRLLISGAAEEQGIGYVRESDWATVQDMLLSVGLLDDPLDLEAAIDGSFWEAVPAEYREIGDREALLERITTNTGN